MQKQLVFVLLALFQISVWTQLVQTQNAGGVAFVYHPPARVSVGEPIAIDLVLQNKLASPISVALGKNDVGNLQLTLGKPDGKVSTVDPRKIRPGDPSEQGFSNTPISVPPNESRTVHILLNEWFPDIQTEGMYQLTVDFIGDVRRNDGQTVELSRRATVTFPVLPAEPAALDEVCKRLVRIVRTTTVAREARWAAKQLSVVRSPIAIPHLESVIERGKVLEIASVESMAIRTLEKMDTTESRAALLRARLKASPSATTELDQAVSRMIRGVKK